MNTAITQAIGTRPVSPCREVRYSPANETFGGTLNERFAPILSAIDSANSSRSIIRNAIDPKLASRAENILQTIEQSILILKNAKRDLRNLPPVHVYNPDDGSILIELASQNVRAGFTIESVPEESGWYFVTMTAHGQIGASENLQDTNLEKIVIYILSLTLAYS
jgi:hypothetical protein